MPSEATPAAPTKRRAGGGAAAGEDAGGAGDAGGCSRAPTDAGGIAGGSCEAAGSSRRGCATRVVALFDTGEGDRDHHREHQRRWGRDGVTALLLDADIALAEGLPRRILQRERDHEASAHRSNRPLHEELRRGFGVGLPETRQRRVDDLFARRTAGRSRPGELEGRAVRRRRPRSDRDPGRARQRPRTSAHADEPQRRSETSTHDATRPDDRRRSAPPPMNLGLTPARPQNGFAREPHGRASATA